MTADLGFVVHPAQRDAHELAPQRLGDALAERGLAHAGRPDEAQDGRLALRVELAHREELEDALLDLVQTEVVLVEDATRLGEIDLRFARELPGQLDQPVEVAARHRVLGGRLGHALQALQFLARMLLHFLRHAGLGDGLLELALRVAALLALAQLLLDGLELLAQDELALALVHRLLGALVDLARELEHLDPMGQQLQHLVEPRLHVERLQQRLLLGGLDVHEAGDHVGQRARRGEVLHRRHQLLRRLRQQLEHLGRPLLELQEARLDILAGRGAVGETLHARDQERIARQKLLHAEALLPLRDQVMATVLRRDVAQHLRHRTDLVEIVGPGFSLAGSFCSSRPTGRSLLTACCAAAIEPSRPMVNGRIMPGNSTRLRTGTMTSASSGRPSTPPESPDDAGWDSGGAGSGP